MSDEPDRYQPPYPGPGWWAYLTARESLLDPRPIETETKETR